jgi:malonyl-CoA/methylmalonyl-CoA synthetase
MTTNRISVWNRAAWQRHLPPGTDVAGLNLLAGESLPRVWGARWDEAPDEVALVDLGNGGTCFSRADLKHQTAAMAARLGAQGLEPGDTVLMSAGTSTNLVLAHVAALRLGAVVVPVNTAYRERELDHIVRDCRPALAVVDDAERAGWIQSSSDRGRSLPIINLSDPEPLPRVPELAGTRLDRADRDDLALIVYTSGTTGAPKGAMLTHGNLLAASESLRRAWRWTADDGLVLALPLFHIHGLGVGIHGCLLTGARILLLPRFDSCAVLRACSRADATLFFGVPTMWVRLIDAIAEDPEHASALRSLRLMVSGSAPLAPAMFEQIETFAGNTVLERYGMSETMMLISNPYDGERRPGTVGLPLPGVQVRIMAADREAMVEEVGEIQVRGPNVFPGYWNRDEATHDAFEDGGWFRTGDLGRRSADDYVTIVGRAKELIITGGYNVYPREVEEVLETHPGVAEAAVVGVPSREWGEEVAAFVVADPAGEQPTEEALVAWCSERLANYKRPRRFTFIDHIPRNALGKIVRGRLRNL